MNWEEARDTGKDEKRWIIVNLQNPSDFQCQALNRDIWKDEAIKLLIKEHFVFIQYEKGDVYSSQYVNYYLGGDAENDQMYPHVNIIDPRTGENVKTWSGTPFPNALDFHAQLVEFLDRYSLDANSKNPVVKQKQKQPKKDIHAMTEEEMLEMALQNSLEPNGASSAGQALDPDALTKSPEPELRADPLIAKGKEVDNSDTTERTDAADDTAVENEGGSAAFAKIASDHPHTEPDNNPATVTRIQFRHPTGRIIRRFAMGDPVSRIYEWLKAAPLEGKEGLEFELKVMPQGHDLIEDLDKSIAEAGLKNGTVMIEFL
jgi:hypothetical protein